MKDCTIAPELSMVPLKARYLVMISTVADGKSTSHHAQDAFDISRAPDKDA